MMVHSETLFDLNLGSLEEHIESMYSEIVEDKVKASKQILAMCFNPQNISEMVYHDRLFGLLSRTLRDDFKKSQDLTMFIGTVFYIYSQFSQYHGLLLQNQIGDTSLKIIDYQLKKYQVRLREMQTKEVDEKEKRK